MFKIVSTSCALDELNNCLITIGASGRPKSVAWNGNGSIIADKICFFYFKYGLFCWGHELFVEWAQCERFECAGHVGLNA